MFLGDGIAQNLENGVKRERGEEASFDAIRTCVLSSWAMGVNAPFWVWWYKFLEKRWIGGRVMGWVLASASLSPVWNGAFFSYNVVGNHILKGQDGSVFNKLHDKVSTQLLPTVAKSCCLWIPFNYLNFRYIPLDYRMLSGGVVALGWNVFLSTTAAKKARSV
jgi:hypothetical protein